ncbi:F-box/WD repeat-containing protein 5, variant 3, partial [Homalodisca vitripennis]
PNDIFGTWYSDQHLLSGDLYWLAHMVSTTGLWLNKASQETASEHTPILSQLFRFYNTNASSIRAIMVANCLTSESPVPPTCAEVSPPPPPATERGNPLSHRDINRRSASFRCNMHVDDAPPSDQQSSEGEGQSSAICYNTDYRMFERQWQQSHDSDSDGCSSDEVEVESEVSDMSVEGDEEDLAQMPEKYLIFTTGSKTYSPHQIGLKRIKPVTLPPVLAPGITLQDRLAERRERRQREREREDAGFPPRVDPDWLDYAAVADRFDTIDHVIDLHGHIIGMGLSPDHRQRSKSSDVVDNVTTNSLRPFSWCAAFLYFSCRSVCRVQFGIYPGAKRGPFVFYKIMTSCLHLKYALRSAVAAKGGNPLDSLILDIAAFWASQETH